MKQLAPLKAIRHFCKDCMGFNAQLVNECPFISCKFYHFRFGSNPHSIPRLSALKNIHLYCIECLGTADKVRKCTMPECSVYIYRFGKNPHRKGIGCKGGHPSTLKHQLSLLSALIFYFLLI